MARKVEIMLGVHRQKGMRFIDAMGGGGRHDAVQAAVDTTAAEQCSRNVAHARSRFLDTGTSTRSAVITFTRESVPCNVSTNYGTLVGGISDVS